MGDQWRYIGRYSVSSGWGTYEQRYLWTNGNDTAFVSCNSVDEREIENFPHPNATICYGELSNDYNGDIIALCNNLDVYRETLDQLRNY